MPKGKLVADVVKDKGRFSGLVFALRLLGIDIEPKKESETDEEIWRSTEEGRHFKFESNTGEVKAGFGGRFNGKKLGESWGTGKAKGSRLTQAPRMAGAEHTGTKTAPLSGFSSKRWNEMETSAKSSGDFTKWSAGLTEDQKKEIEDQRKQCGTQESPEAYSQRVYDMLTGKLDKVPPAASHAVAHGKDITKTYHFENQNSEPAGTQEIDTAIEDVIHKQGFDGVPKVVGQDEFDRIVKENPKMPILLRTYTAPNKEMLDEYDKQLESGFFYVDCGTGGAQYGQGMYCAGAYNLDVDRFDSLTKSDLQVPGVLFSANDGQVYKTLEKEEVQDPGFFLTNTPYLIKDKEGKMRLTRLNDETYDLEDAETGEPIADAEKYVSEAQGVWECKKDGTASREVAAQNAEKEMDDYIKIGRNRAFAEYKKNEMYEIPNGMKICECGTLRRDLDADSDLTDCHAFYFDPKKGTTFEEREPEIGERFLYYNMDSGAPKSNYSVWEKREDGKIHLVDGPHTDGYYGTGDATIDINDENFDGYFEKSDKWFPIAGRVEPKPFKAHASVRKMTLDPSSKIVTYRDLDAIKSGFLTSTEEKEITQRVRQENPGVSSDVLDQKCAEEIKRAEKRRQEESKEYSRFDDYGVLAAALGYDAINAEGHGKSGSYTVVLNRTKVILCAKEDAA